MGVGSELLSLVERANLIEDKIVKLEAEAAGWKEDLRIIYEDALPMCLHEHGLAAAPLEDGRTIVIENVVNVKQGDKAALAAWLKARRYDSIIRTTIEMEKGADTTPVEDTLRGMGIEYSKSMEIHPMSLKKVLREHIAGGGDYPPEDAAFVSIYERAKIKGTREE